MHAVGGQANSAVSFPTLHFPEEPIMKKRILAFLILLFILSLIGGLAYYAHQTSRVEAELNAFVQRSESSKPVTVDFSVAVPADTPKDQIIYLSGSVPSLGNWDAAGLALQPKDDGRWHGSAQVLSGIGYGFKVTRGTWGTVETDAAGSPIPDRTLQVPADQTVELNVAEWVDHGKAIPGRITLTGDIRLLKNFHSNLLSNDRTLIIYLPPGYDRHPDVRYPVLYMQDGQNIFDESTSFAGVEWQMDEAAQKLIGDDQVTPFIIVGIYNTPDRTAEFTPPPLVSSGSSASARGDLYARFLVEGIKPFIDRTYRTQPDRSHTLIGGGSMGGLISLYTAQTHPNIFGQIVILSPWLRLNDAKLLPVWLGDGRWLHSERIYCDMGTEPGNNGANYPGGASAAIADGNEFAAALASAGLQPDKDFNYRQIQGGHHDEASFQARIESVLKWVFAK